MLVNDKIKGKYFKYLGWVTVFCNLHTFRRRPCSWCQQSIRFTVALCNHAVSTGYDSSSTHIWYTGEVWYEGLDLPSKITENNTEKLYSEFTYSEFAIPNIPNGGIFSLIMSERLQTFKLILTS